MTSFICRHTVKLIVADWLNLQIVMNWQLPFVYFYHNRMTVSIVFDIIPVYCTSAAKLNHNNHSHSTI